MDEKRKSLAARPPTDESNSNLATTYDRTGGVRGLAPRYAKTLT